MNEQETAFFKAFYDNTVKARHAEGWKISLAEWMAFWITHPYRSKKVATPRSISLRRHDESEPWAIGNIVAYSKSDAWQRRVRPVVVVDKTAIRTLTVAEWISEVRG